MSQVREVGFADARGTGTETTGADRWVCRGVEDWYGDPECRHVGL